MIHYIEFYLDNGLQVIIHEDHSIPLAAVNILYKVGARDELPAKTGFAHLFEHLMFGGSRNIPSYDGALQKVGGENNAFTNSDFTNYYLTVPAINLETAFWLESDRMLDLSFDPEVLNVQRKVVIEEYKQRYLNQPYGDLWLKLRPLAYKVHPYQWTVIGKDISHIENAAIEDVKAFFEKFYAPNNAILVVAGDIRPEKVKKLADKWFGPIQPGNKKLKRRIPAEPEQKSKRIMETSADVPLDSLNMVWHMPGRLDPQYHACDLLSDILGRGKSSRLYYQLVKNRKIFNTINAYITGSMDPGLFVITGTLNKGINFGSAEEEILIEIEKCRKDKLPLEELDKVKIQAETSLAYSEVEIVNRAMNLAYFAYLGDPGRYNLEIDEIQKVNGEQLNILAADMLYEANSSILYYSADNKTE